MQSPDETDEISIEVSFYFSAKDFARWLSEGFRNSNYKTITELAKDVQSNKATISRLMSGSPQTLTGKPSQPKLPLVRRLAKALNANEDDGLLFAGYGGYLATRNRRPKNIAEFLEALEAMGLEQFAFSADKEVLANYTPEDFEELLERIKADVEITIRRKPR